MLTFFFFECIFSYVRIIENAQYNNSNHNTFRLAIFPFDMHSIFFQNSCIFSSFGKLSRVVKDQGHVKVPPTCRYQGDVGLICLKRDELFVEN